MSGGHYDCFYCWEDFDAVAGKIGLLKEVLKDYEAEPDLAQASAFLREAVQRLEETRTYWGASPCAALCSAMDWYKSCDYGPESFREAVRIHLSKAGVEVDDIVVMLAAAEKEIGRLEDRFLEETKAHDKTRHVLHCRELELERLRSNMYKQRVEECVEKEKRDVVPPKD